VYRTDYPSVGSVRGVAQAQLGAVGPVVLKLDLILNPRCDVITHIGLSLQLSVVNFIKEQTGTV